MSMRIKFLLVAVSALLLAAGVAFGTPGENASADERQDRNSDPNDAAPPMATQASSGASAGTEYLHATPAAELPNPNRP